MTDRSELHQSYKEQKQLFVSNLTGSSISEINAVTAVAPAAYILTSALHSRLGFFAEYGVLQFLVDFGLNVGTILLATTTYADRPLLLCALLVGPALVLLAQGQGVKRQTKKTPRKPPKKRTEKEVVEVKPEVGLPKKAFITTYRGAMMTITCLAILAVDFKVFPRRFAKVETWGTSLMDLGVGSFVFSSGLVAARPVVAGKVLPPLAKRLQAALRSTAALLVLGFVRLVLVKGVDYAEHVTEYGIHWNFFFTLALLPMFSTLALPLTTNVHSVPPSVLYAGIACGIASIDQFALSNLGLLKFVLTAPRHSMGLISQNKEGIFSFPGYLAIFFAGTAAGCSCLPSRPNTALGLAKWAFFWIGAFWLVDSSAGPFRLEVSRRVANAPYVFWVAAFNTAQLTGFTLVERVFPQNSSPSSSSQAEKVDPEESQSTVLTAFNDNGLAIFLLANVGTGLVNLTFDALGAGTGKALGILGVYALTLAVAAVGLHVRGVRIKL
ncbi:GPI-anchored wall transfer protein 1 [Ascobolus immersus RN42]|uniref:GPI-anchored wall transfer protein n=1 Tax=Ascobolus immersus RN42 TaxID=1160509 RepID=A0A3N4HYX4_ASCIM|nr:GPI-anchored wall transfer protein 1 [Ascobolus immersus RN42]